MKPRSLLVAPVLVLALASCEWFSTMSDPASIEPHERMPLLPPVGSVPLQGLPDFDLTNADERVSNPRPSAPASLDMAKARAMMPDWTTFNGYANQYVTHPLPAKPGENVRFYVVAAGPTLSTAFHVVGTIFNRAWVNGDMTQFQQGVQTVGVPAGGGAVFDVKIDEPGLYPFVSHAFAHVDLGQVGLLKVGNPPGTMGH